jgi:hypothetical protein
MEALAGQSGCFATMSGFASIILKPLKEIPWPQPNPRKRTRA